MRPCRYLNPLPGLIVSLISLDLSTLAPGIRSTCCGTAAPTRTSGNHLRAATCAVGRFQHRCSESSVFIDFRAG